MAELQTPSMEPSFEPLCESERQRLSALGTILDFDPGECVVEPGSELAGIHVVLAGLCMLTPASRMRARDGRALAAPGHCFGSLVVGMPETARYRVRALEPTRILHLDGAAVQKLILKDLPLGSRLLHQAREEQLAYYEGLGCAARSARISAVYGLRGGAGATSFAVSMAAAAAARDERVLLLDLHPFFGNAASSCGVRVTKTLADLPATGAIDQRALEEVIGTAGGFDVVAAPVDPNQGDAVTWPRVDALLGAVADRYDLVVMDLPTGVDALVIGALEVADRLVLVSTADFPGLAAIRTAMSLVDALEIGRQSVEIVVNRYQQKGGIREENIQRLVGQTITVVAEDGGDMLRAVNEGKMMDLARQCQEHPFTKAARDVALRCLDPVRGLGPRIHKLEPKKLCSATVPSHPSPISAALRAAGATRTGGILATFGLVSPA